MDRFVTISTPQKMQKFLFAYAVETSRGAVTYHLSLPLEKNVASYEPLS